AIDRAVSFRLKWHLGLFATIGTDGCIQLARTATLTPATTATLAPAASTTLQTATLFACGPTFRATAGCISQTVAGVKLLLSNCKGELPATVPAIQRLIIHKSSPSLSWEPGPDFGLSTIPVLRIITRIGSRIALHHTALAHYTIESGKNIVTMPKIQ